MRTVELLGDDELERTVRAAWRRLDQAGFSSLARHRHPTNRPHLTLASSEQFPPAAAAAIAGALRMLPVLVRLDGLRFFGGRAGGWPGPSTTTAPCGTAGPGMAGPGRRGPQSAP